VLKKNKRSGKIQFEYKIKVCDLNFLKNVYKIGKAMKDKIKGENFRGNKII
jgi:hypothetical protein